MKVIVDKEKCIGCGSCVNICDEVFEFDEEGFAEANNREIIPELEEEVMEALNCCPTCAIKKIEE